MQITLDDSAHVSTSNASGSVGLTLADATLLICIHSEVDSGGLSTFSAVNWNTSEAFTSFHTFESTWGRGDTEAWYLNNPTFGSHNFSYTRSGGGRGFFSIFALSNADVFPGGLIEVDDQQANPGTILNFAPEITPTSLACIHWISHSVPSSPFPATFSLGAIELAEVSAVDGGGGYGYAPSDASFRVTYNITDNSTGIAVSVRRSSGGGAKWWFSKVQDFYDDLKKGLIPKDQIERRYQQAMAYQKA